jgi:hypothetical protein
MIVLYVKIGPSEDKEEGGMIILVLLGESIEKKRERNKQDWNTVVCYTTLRFPPPRLCTCGTRTFSLCILQSTGIEPPTSRGPIVVCRYLSVLIVLYYH